MNLNELSPSVSREKKFRVGRGHASGTEKLAEKDTKVKIRVRAVEFVPDLRADKCLFTDVCRSADLQTYLRSSMLKLTFLI